ncbi:hypothetical protein E8E11_000229 [Didymella keratinophila]|nr:hypothetical protein E8E11_000229 [Didymella keratinophila]
MDEYFRSLPEPASRLDHGGLEEHITNLAREAQKVQPERKIENIEAELYNEAFKLRYDLDARARETQRPDVEVHSQKQQAGATPSSEQDHRRPGPLEQLNEPFFKLLASRSEVLPKIGMEVLRDSTEGKCEAGPGPSTLASRVRSFHHVTADTTNDVTSVINDDVTHGESFLKNFLVAHHKRMRAHIKKERLEQAGHIQHAQFASKFKARPSDILSSDKRVPLESNPDYQQAQAQFHAAGEDVKSIIDVLIREKGGMDHTDSAYRAASEQWQKAADRLEALEARQKVAQSLIQPTPKAVFDHARNLSSACISSVFGPSYGTFTPPRTAPRPPLMGKSSDGISLKCHKDTGGPKNCSDCLARLRNDIVDIENLARKMRAEYQAARAKIEGTADSVVVNGDDRAEEGGRKGKERV